MTIGSLDPSAPYEPLIEERIFCEPPSLGCPALEQSANTPTPLSAILPEPPGDDGSDWSDLHGPAHG